MTSKCTMQCEHLSPSWPAGTWPSGPCVARLARNCSVWPGSGDKMDSAADTLKDLPVVSSLVGSTMHIAYMPIYSVLFKHNRSEWDYIFCTSYFHYWKIGAEMSMGFSFFQTRDDYWPCISFKSNNLRYYRKNTNIVQQNTNIIFC